MSFKTQLLFRNTIQGSESSSTQRLLGNNEIPFSPDPFEFNSAIVIKQSLTRLPRGVWGVGWGAGGLLTWC